ncbi:MAG TPA: DUF1524 domain-containing protein [Candidatus Corynebacterium avicola]|uniref:DUF1524 domain-containing protein n=1 Tax=Candidatus Corynebacterium avicola TaxID=2838527 RepID=A0A9D1UJZ3_9CORY|nr:DUF1524 domain-containing protein [Candidatus Corynebacterium avicola]
MCAVGLTACSSDDSGEAAASSTTTVTTRDAATEAASDTTSAEASASADEDADADSGDGGAGASEPLPTSADAEVQDALTTLATLDVKGRASKTGYTRDQFGQRWKDIDRNGCDQRNDVLARDMTGVQRQGPCKVMSGTLDDPFTGQAINFVRGQGTSEAVQIDHVVALSDAWQKGAQQLSAETREQFANDHLNLLAVDGPANMQKSDGDAATWLPSNKGFRCTYVARQVEVKAKYELWVTSAERDAIARILGGCGAGELAPVNEAPAPVADPSPAPDPAPAQAPAPQPAAPAPAQEPVYPAGGGEPYYANCTAARAAGAAPLYAGSPGYRSAMDRDGDGVACE